MQIQAFELPEGLKSTENSLIQKCKGSNEVLCTVCNVRLNSPQLLPVHLEGKKHKQKALKRAPESANPAEPNVKEMRLTEFKSENESSQ